METLTRKLQLSITPESALEMLMEGNNRFLRKKQIERDLNKQVKETKSGQFPFAAILGCIDSRVPAEYLFDQGIGDIFSARVAGNIVNKDILGSLEYSCKVAGSKLVLVLGHTECGAVTAACKKVELGNITGMLAKINPATDAFAVQINSGNYNVNEVAERNVLESISAIRKQSPILTEMEDNKEIIIQGAMYDVSTGKVSLL